MAEKPQPPNLDLIQMVQAARMQHDAQAVPSQVAAVYWIESKPTMGDPAAPTVRAGKWVIPTTLREVDALWETVKRATEAGELGYKAKVSTSAGPGQRDPDARVIHVCTYDGDDSADVARVGQQLRMLGIVTGRYER